MENNNLDQAVLLLTALVKRSEDQLLYFDEKELQAVDGGVQFFYDQETDRYALVYVTKEDLDGEN